MPPGTVRRHFSLIHEIASGRRINGGGAFISMKAITSARSVFVRVNE